MPPLPKRKIPKAYQGRRRAHLGVVMPVLAYCPQCHSPKLAHRVCLTCGTYRGRQVVTVKTKKGT